MEDETVPTPKNEQDNRVFIILDEIRRDVSKVMTDVAVLAAAQPRITDIVEDHERRIRVLENLTHAFASLVERTALVETELADERERLNKVKAEQDKNAWVPRLFWGAVAVVISVLTSAAVGGLLSR